jgi:hypothetical protein
MGPAGRYRRLFCSRAACVGYRTDDLARRVHESYVGPRQAGAVANVAEARL